MNGARISISPELLEQWLCLPKGNRIIGARWDLSRGQPVLTVRVEGPDMPDAAPGAPLPEFTPTYRRIDHELVSLGEPREV